MSNNTESADIRARLGDLLDYIKTGRGIEAMEEFYTDDCEMQENFHPPTKGKAANIEREKAFFASVKEWKTFNVTGLAAEDGVSFYESNFSFINQDDQLVEYKQVTVARWRDGKIYHERFYYDSGA